jgi:uncharacterized membrane protein YkoI
MGAFSMTRTGISSISALAAAALVSFAPLSHAALRKHEDEAAKASVTLVQAAESGERAGQGKTIGVEFDVENNHPIWEVKVLSASGVNEYKVDATSGQVLKVEQEHIRGKITTAVTGLKLDQLQAVAVPLPQAVSTAEQKLGGKAVKVEVEHEHHAIQYDVFVRKPGHTDHVKIAASK